MTETISVNSEILEELYANIPDDGYPINDTPEPTGEYRSVASEDLGEGRWLHDYRLVFERIEDGALFGCGYGVALTEFQESHYPWSPEACGRWDSKLHKYVDLKPVECVPLIAHTETVVVTRYEVVK